jgi:hypothetical protein
MHKHDDSKKNRAYNQQKNEASSGQSENE